MVKSSFRFLFGSQLPTHRLTLFLLSPFLAYSLSACQSFPFSPPSPSSPPSRSADGSAEVTERAQGGSPSSPPSPKPLEYKIHPLPNSIVHSLVIPAQSSYVVTPVIAQGLDSLEGFVQKTGAIAALNGGFFDPKNQKSTSSIILQGYQVAKPEDNERLMTNPDVLPYLDKVLNRAEFRRYSCGGILQYEIALRQRVPLPSCHVEDALGAGPQLFPATTLVQEGFRDVQNGKLIRDALGSDRRNARSAIGLTAEGNVVWIMVAQKPDAPQDSGMTLQELTDFMEKTFKVKSAMNLDGGSSSALYFSGQTLYGKVDESGKSVQRSVKSVLVVQKKEN